MTGEFLPSIGTTAIDEFLGVQSAQCREILARPPTPEVHDALLDELALFDRVEIAPPRPVPPRL